MFLLKIKLSHRAIAFGMAVIFTVTTSLVVSPSELFAAPSVGTPVAAPGTVLANTPTQVLVTLPITIGQGDAPVVPTGLYLYKVDAAKKVLATLGTMHDDGLNGDAVRGDNVFSLLIDVNVAPPGPFRIQASVPFKGVVRRTLSAVLEIPISVNNQPPVFTSTPEITETANGVEFAYEMSATDPEGGEVEFSLVSGPAGSKVLKNFFLWTPTESQIGDHPVQVQAKDPQGASATQNFLIHVQQFNLTPIITSVPQTYAKTAEKYTYDVEAYDPDGKPLTYTFGAPPPSGMVINQQTGLIEYTPGNGAVGVQEVTVDVSDDLGATDQQVYDLNVLNKNVPLELISPVGQHQVLAGETLELPLDANIDTAIFSVFPLPENASADQSFFKFTPTAAQVGFHTLSFQAKVGDLTVSNTVIIEVTKTNTPPQFAAVQPQSVLEGQTLSFILSATDADSDPLTITTPGLTLANGFFNQLTNQFLFTPSYDQQGVHNVVFEVTDGADTAQITVQITVQNVEPPAALLSLVVDKTPNPTFRGTLPVTGNVTGQPGVPAPPEQPVYITGLDPSEAGQGETLEVNLTGANTNFAEGQSVASFGEGITVETLEIISPTSAKAKIVIAGNAEVGPRQVKIVTADEEAISIVAFNVEEGSASVSGRVIDSFTLQPLSSARVSINGTPVFVVSGADGKFTLNDVPPGEQVLTITRSNYAVNQFGVVLNHAEIFAMPEDIPLRALARPFSAGGSLPRAATIASVLDRGASTKEVDMTLDQAKAVIQDTMIVVGGDEAGVVDEAGNQLNPNVAGFGQFTLTQKGVENQAKALLSGEVYTLKQFHTIITTAFKFPLGLSLAQLIEGFQEAANEAWNNPLDPSNAMAIVLFSDGTFLTPQPPVISESTRFNRLQMFLLATSLLAFNSFDLNISAERLLNVQGIDFESMMPAPAFPNPAAGGGSGGGSGGGPGGLSSSPTFAQKLAAFMVPDVHAEDGSNPCTAPSCKSRDLIGQKTFTKVYRKVGANMIYECSYAAAFAAVIAAAQLAFIGMTIGLTGGVAGLATAGLTILAAASLGFASTAFFKAVIGWYIAFAASSFEPPPPLVHNTETDALGNLVIPFDRAPEEINTLQKEATLNGNTDHLRRSFTYLLYRFNTCQLDAGDNDGELIPVLPIEDPRHPSNINRNPHIGRLQFVVPPSLLTPGPNHFRIQTVQYVHHASKNLMEGIGAADTDHDGFINLEDFQKAGLGDKNSFVGFDRNDDKKLSDDEFRQYPVPQQLKITPDFPNAPASTHLARVEGNPQDVNQGILAAEQAAEQKRRLDVQQQVEVELLNNMRKQYQENLVPDNSFVTDNEASFKLGDDIYRETFDSGRGLAGNSIVAADDVIPDMAEDIARRHYQEKLGVQPTQAQIDRVQDMLKIQVEASRRRLQLQEMGASMRELGDAMETVRNSPTDVDVEIRIPTGFKMKAGGFPPFGKIEVLKSGENFISYNEFEYESLTVNKSNLDDIDADFRDAERPLSKTRNMNGMYEHMFKINGPNSMGDHEMVVPATEEPNATLRSQDLVKEAIGQVNNLSPEEVKARVGSYTQNRNSTAIDQNGLAKAIAAQEDRIMNQFDIERQLTRTRPALGGGERIMPPAGLSPHFEKSIGVLGDVAGGYISGAVTIATFLDSIQVLNSEFSQGCTTKIIPNTPVPTETFPPGIEPFPSYHQIAAILKEVRRTGSKDGWLRREYPAEEEAFTEASTGFPPGFLTSDGKEYLYAINMASAEKFGGRIFRFKPVEDNFVNGPIRGFGLERELVGAVNYYSLSIQIARPANPIAMVVGPDYTALGSSGTVKAHDLFVANIDIVDGAKRILRVPISLIKTSPEFYGELPGVPSSQGRRHRIVGQPMIEDPDFKFTGPSDMEVGPDTDFLKAESGPKSVVMFSDESNIFVFQKAGGPEFYNAQKVISMPGKRWSGMAFDRRGRFYFAEYVTGDIYVMEWKDLHSLIVDGKTITDQAEFDQKAIRIAANIPEPGDIEIEFNSEHPGQVLNVSTFNGVLPITLPIIGKIGSGVQEIKVDIFNKEIPARLDLTNNRFIAQPTRFQMIRKSVNIRVRRLNAQGRSYWTEHTVSLSDNGITFVEQPL